MRRLLQPVASLVREPFSSVGWDRMSTRLGVTLLIVSAVFFAANFADKAWISYQVAQVKHQRLAQIDEARRTIDQLRGELAYYHSRQYYVAAARDYGYILPGDVQISLDTRTVSHDVSVTVPPRPHRHTTLFQNIMQAVVPGL